MPRQPRPFQRRRNGKRALHDLAASLPRPSSRSRLGVPALHDPARLQVTARRAPRAQAPWCVAVWRFAPHISYHCQGSAQLAQALPGQARAGHLLCRAELAHDRNWWIERRCWTSIAIPRPSLAGGIPGGRAVLRAAACRTFRLQHERDPLADGRRDPAISGRQRGFSCNPPGFARAKPTRSRSR